jgi:hypothetical protein
MSTVGEEVTNVQNITWKTPLEYTISEGNYEDNIKLYLTEIYAERMR